MAAPARSSGPSFEQREVKYGLRIVDGVAKRVPIVEVFVVTGHDFEIGDQGFASFVDRVEHMAAITERTSRVTVEGMDFMRRDPRAPYACVTVRLEAFYFPTPIR